MAYAPFNVRLGYKLSEKPTGGAIKAGTLPHFLADASTFCDWWQRLLADVVATTQDQVLVTAMIALAQQVNCWAMSAEPDDMEAWPVSAHRLLSRFDRFCATADITALTEAASEEKETATLRVRSLRPPRVTIWPNKRAAPSHANQPAYRRPRVDTPRGTKHCDHHGTCNHSTAECAYLKKQQQQQPSSSHGK